jgi:hypothetical protein
VVLWPWDRFDDWGWLMTISEKTRKILWGASGKKCALCRCPLVVEASSLDDDSVVGDECHVVSPKGQGPRFDPDLPADQVDALANLVLLCRVHHKMVDDQPATWTAERLRDLKAKHEAWVEDCLADGREALLGRPRLRRLPGQASVYLSRLQSGRELLGIIVGACSGKYSNDEPSSEEEMEAIASFFQLVQDYGDLYGDLEAGERVRVAYQLNAAIEEVESAGFWVFGAREMRRLEGGVGSPAPWPIAILRLVRSDSYEITRATHGGAPEKDRESSQRGD